MEPFNPLESSLQSDVFAAVARRQISEIVGSYHHRFDHFYEAVQNAVDACEKAFDGTQGDYAPVVRIEIDLVGNTATIVDNGRGMAKDVLKDFFFTPFATLKGTNGGPRQRGEKGVGASFLSYGSEFLRITTKEKNSGQVTAGELRGGLAWCRDQDGPNSMPLVKPHQPHPAIVEMAHGTAVTIGFSERTNVPSLAECGTDLKQWAAIFRLYTAIGYVSLDESDDPFAKALRAHLVLRRGDGTCQEGPIETGYLYPHLATSASVRLSQLTRSVRGHLPETQRDMLVAWDTFSPTQVSELVSLRMENQKWLRQSRRARLSGILSERRPSAYVAFVYAKDFWKERNLEYWSKEEDGQLQPGKRFATKSQVIGEARGIDFTYRSGDMYRFFILLSFENLKADIGRKSLADDYNEFGDFFANAIQKRFVDSGDCLTPSPGPFTESEERDLEQIADAAYDREDIGLPGLALSKKPDQEQDVVALFFALLGSGVIKGYELYATSISRTYDGVGRFRLRNLLENQYDRETRRLGMVAGPETELVESKKKCFVEFKYSTDGLVKDVRAGYKRLQDVKWLVCWEVGGSHTDEGISILDITEPQYANRRDYHGVTHLMTEGADKVYVICLSTVLTLTRQGLHEAPGLSDISLGPHSGPLGAHGGPGGGRCTW